MTDMKDGLSNGWIRCDAVNPEYQVRCFKIKHTNGNIPDHVIHEASIGKKVIKWQIPRVEYFRDRVVVWV